MGVGEGRDEVVGAGGSSMRGPGREEDSAACLEAGGMQP